MTSYVRRAVAETLALFVPTGTIGRRTYGLAAIALPLLTSAAAMAYGWKAAPVGLACVYVIACLGAKRLRRMGRSQWWQVIPPLLWALTFWLLLLHPDEAEVSLEPGGAYFALWVAVFVAMLLTVLSTLGLVLWLSLSKQTPPADPSEVFG